MHHLAPRESFRRCVRHVDAGSGDSRTSARATGKTGRPSLHALSAVNLRSLLLAALVSTALAAPPFTTAALATPADDFRAALGPVFQADEPATLARLHAISRDALDEKSRAALDCIVDRFEKGAAAPEVAALSNDLRPILAAYQRYWTTVLMKRATIAEGDATLSRELGRLLPDAPADLDARGAAAVRLAESQGWHALGGFTSPLHDFMAWQTQATHREHVDLPGGAVDVNVTLLDGFANYGWGAWGTCDRAHTGGWTNEEGLFVVVPAWDLAGEDYRVSLLAHEAQHFSDNVRFPKLAQTDLEYRAKLVELVQARETQASLLAAFAAGAKRDRALPHPFAQWWVMTRLEQRLGTADWHAWDAGRIRAEAELALRTSTSELAARGAATVETALPD
jgi:hypothetical protein